MQNRDRKYVQCLGTFVYTSAGSNELGRIYFADFLPSDCFPELIEQYVRRIFRQITCRFI
jgi:hypothetical protein